MIKKAIALALITVLALGALIASNLTVKAEAWPEHATEPTFEAYTNEQITSDLFLIGSDAQANAVRAVLENNFVTGFTVNYRDSSTNSLLAFFRYDYNLDEEDGYSGTQDIIYFSTKQFGYNYFYVRSQHPFLAGGGFFTETKPANLANATKTIILLINGGEDYSEELPFQFQEQIFENNSARFESFLAAVSFEEEKISVSYYIDSSLHASFEIYKSIGNKAILQSVQKEGFFFLHWEDQYQRNYSPAQRVSFDENIVLHAVYQQLSYTFTIRAFGQVALTDELVFGAGLLLPELPDVEGYTALGYSITSTGSVLYEPGEQISMPASNLTLYAIYEEIEQEDPNNPGTGTEDPTPGDEEPTDPNDDSNIVHGGGFLDFLKGPWNWLKGAGSDVGGFIGGVAKGVGKFFSDNVETFKIIGLSVLAVAVVAGIGMLIFSPGAIIVGAKALSLKAIPVLKLLATKVLLPLLITAGPWILLFGAGYLIIGKPAIDALMALKKIVEDLFINPGNDLGIPIWILWPLVIIIAANVLKAVNNLIKRLLGFGKKPAKKGASK